MLTQQLHDSILSCAAALCRKRQRRRQPNACSRRLRYEPLENRRLLSITVNTLVDEADGSIVDGDISLRDAIALAPPGETIDFSVTGTINLSVGSHNSNKHLTIDKSLAINGPGANFLTIKAFDPDVDGTDDGDGSRVFNIDDGIGTLRTVSISALTLTGGDVFGDGGAILNREMLNVVRCKITGNAASASGGGMFGGSLSIAESTISYNSADQDGGGIGYSASLLLLKSTISGNSAGGNGGGIGNGHLTIDNSTISANTAAYGIGGGIFSDNGMTVRHSTITGNSANWYGGGVATTSHEYAGVVQLYTSVIADNANSFGEDDVSAYNPLSHGYNLIGDEAGGPFGWRGPTDQYNVADPKLGPLADNGGPTKTHALLPGSPAINAGDPASVAGVGDVPLYDQRGAPFTRVHGGRIDIGAFELQSMPPALPGDYNQDGTVDAADYTLWRDTLGAMATPYSGADGSGNGAVDQSDYDVWGFHFGMTLSAAGGGSASEFAALEIAAAFNNDTGSMRLMYPVQSVVSVVDAGSLDPDLKGPRGHQRYELRPLLLPTSPLRREALTAAQESRPDIELGEKSTELDAFLSKQAVCEVFRLRLKSVDEIFSRLSVGEL